MLGDYAGDNGPLAAYALGLIGPPARAAQPALERELLNPIPNARMRAMEALELIRGVEALPAIQQKLSDPDRDVRARAAQLVASLNQKLRN